MREGLNSGPLKGIAFNGRVTLSFVVKSGRDWVYTPSYE